MGHQDLEIDEMVGSYPTCGACGSKKVVRDAWAEWNGLTRQWVLKTVFDEFACDGCGESTTPVWKIDKKFRTKRICRLNDEMRIGNFKHGMVVVTAGVQALSDEWIATITNNISLYKSFSEDNDPHGEHDFGSLEVNGKKIFWKIDYFDLELEMHSPDAANPDVTHRVLTIMLASEY
jgi:hypothetical protein